MGQIGLLFLGSDESLFFFQFGDKVLFRARLDIGKSKNCVPDGIRGPLRIILVQLGESTGAKFPAQAPGTLLGSFH